MDIEQSWELALRRTEIIRSRVLPLATFEATKIPYIFLSEGPGGAEGTFVRKGHVWVEKPALILPSNQPQLRGFDFGESGSGQAGRFMDFLFIRGVRFPSLKFDHRTEGLSVYDGRLQAAITSYKELLQREENTSAGLVAGPEECWQLSILIFVAAQILRSADGDIHRLLEEFRREKKDK